MLAARIFKQFNYRRWARCPKPCFVTCHDATISRDQSARLIVEWLTRPRFPTISVWRSPSADGSYCRRPMVAERCHVTCWGAPWWPADTVVLRRPELPVWRLWCCKLFDQLSDEVRKLAGNSTEPASYFRTQPVRLSISEISTVANLFAAEYHLTTSGVRSILVDFRWVGLRDVSFTGWGSDLMLLTGDTPRHASRVGSPLAGSHVFTSVDESKDEDGASRRELRRSANESKANTFTTDSRQF